MIRLKKLPNGIRVATEKIPSVSSCGIGLWVEVGSRHESDEERGLTHFVEHMLFKGTPGRNARQIADALNVLGGNANAFTSQEVLCLHARTVAHKAHEALDLLAELLLESTFPEEEIPRERQVVLEEYKMYEDNPDDCSLDLFLRNLWPRDPLGRSVLGTRRTIGRFSREALTEYWRRQFHPQRLLIAMAGSFDAAACGAVIRRRFEPLQAAGPPPPRPPARHAIKARPRRTYLRRPVEQAHFCFGCLGPHRRSADRFAFGLMNMILGGGMSSRLFQEIREKRGLAYSIGSFSQQFSDRGFFAVSGGTSIESLGDVVKLTMEELARICEENVPEAELVMAREQVIDAMLMSQENTEARMMRMADSLLSTGRVMSLEEAVQRLRGVGAAEIRRTAAAHLRAVPLALGSIGPEGGAWPTAGPFQIA